MSNKFISILMPMGGEFGPLHAMLTNLLPLSHLLGTELQVVVADYKGLDNTARMLEQFRAQGMDIVCAEVTHTNSIEHIMLQGLGSCAGSYTLLMRLKDRLNIAQFAAQLSALRASSEDLIVTNLQVKSLSGTVAHKAFVSDKTEILGYTGAKVVTDIGFTGLLHNMSGIIVRTALLQAVDYNRYFEISPVYLFGAVLLHAFHDCPASLRQTEIAEMVYDRSDLGAEFDFDMILKRRKLAREFPWSLGIMRLVDAVIQQAGLDSRFFSTLQERNPSAIYGQAHHSFNKLLEQITAAITKREGMSPFAEDDAEMLMRIYSDIVPGFPTKFMEAAYRLSGMLWRIDTLLGFLSGEISARAKTADNVLLSKFKHLTADERKAVQDLLASSMLEELAAVRHMVNS